MTLNMKRVVSTLLLGIFVIFFEEVITEVVITPVNVTVSENQAVTLTCTLMGSSEAVKYFTWSYKRSSEQNEAPVGVLKSTCSSLLVPINTSLYEYACPSITKSTWTIKKVTRLNHGERYKCNIETSSRNENSEFTFLQVQVPISSVNMTVPSSESVTVNQNESREFKCKTSGLPTATVSWYKDSGTPRDFNDDIEITSNVVTSSRTTNDLIEVTSTLTYSPSKNDNGWRIYCTASNINGQTPIVSSSKPLLNVQYPPDGPPVITGYGGEYHVIEGSQGQLSCSVSGGNPAPTLTWNCINSGTPQTINSGSVTMLHTWMAKRGQDRTCTCIASHYSGNKDVSIDITTFYPPTRPIFKINSTPVEQTVRVIRNNFLSVTCSSEGKPEPSYIWTYPNKTTSVGSQLILSSVQYNGKYTCDAKNRMDPSVGETVPGSNSSFMDVHILYPPVITELGNVSVVEGLQAVISCTVTFGNPPETTFKWKRNGTIWKTSQNVTIETISRSDATIYTCFASNTMQQTGEKPVSQQDAKSLYVNVWCMAERQDCLTDLTNMEIIKRYRFDSEGIRYLENLLSGSLQPHTARHHSLSVREKILITLRFLASGEQQINNSDIHHVAQSTVSKVVTEVVYVLSSPEIVQRFVHFPVTRDELNRQVQQFYGLAHFPKVVGVIDGTHIRILAPVQDEDLFINRKGYHSINIQLVSDAFDNITDVAARWPGSTHDSRILHNSGLRQLFETGVVPAGYHLLGDSGYPCKSWLLTPYIHPQPGSQSSYNRAHKITRSKVERCIGQLKRRFGVLHGEIRMHPEKACRIVTACVVLHNICKRRGIQLPDVNDERDDDQPDNDDCQNIPQIGLRYRDYIANTYF